VHDREKRIGAAPREYDMVRTRLVLAALTLAIAGPASVVAGSASGSAAGSAPGPAPYRNPPFHCHVHHYGNGKAPNPLKTKADPLCVDYNKRDITVDNGGAIRFAEAEPARFAVAGKCDYWQQDHWRVRLDRGFGPIVRWDGSYWFDITSGSGGAILRHFRIAGQPVGPTQAAAALATMSPSLAKQIRKYGAGPSGGGGASTKLPSGLTCSTPTS
jgi:hypothetical protein